MVRSKAHVLRFLSPSSHLCSYLLHPNCLSTAHQTSLHKTWSAHGTRMLRNTWQFPNSDTLHSLSPHLPQEPGPATWPPQCPKQPAHTFLPVGAEKCCNGVTSAECDAFLPTHGSPSLTLLYHAALAAPWTQHGLSPTPLLTWTLSWEGHTTRFLHIKILISGQAQVSSFRTSQIFPLKSFHVYLELIS